MKLLIKTFILSFLLIILPLQAETIILKDGNSIKGTIVSQDSSILYIQNIQGIQTIDNATLYKIYYTDSILETSEKYMFAIGNIMNTLIKPITGVKWAVGAGVSYAHLGNQLGLVINKRWEILISRGWIPGYSHQNFAGTQSDSFDTSGFSLRYYYDLESPKWIPGTGAYLSLNYTNFQYYFNTYSGGSSFDGLYSYNANQGTIGIGFNGKYGILLTNAEIGYSFMFSENRTSNSINSSWWDYGIENGLNLSLGLGIAL